MSKNFSRYTATATRSFAMRSLNSRETEINEHFWSFKVISDYSGYLARAQKDREPLSETAALFFAKGPDARRVPPTVSDWLDAQKELENWLRQSAIVSAAAYFEAYIGQVVRSALMSDPMTRHGASRSIDGVMFLKKDLRLPDKDEIESITKGDWNARTAAFLRIFGDVPADLKSNISKLEAIRQLRNNYAHGFGRSLEIPDPAQLDGRPADRVSQETFINYVEIISRVSKAIDRYLMKRCIGHFEVILFYHKLLSDEAERKNMANDPVRTLKKRLNSKIGLSVSMKFCRDLIKYYNSQ